MTSVDAVLVRDWLLLAGAAIGVVAALAQPIRAWFVRPLAKLMSEHTEEHALLLRELGPTGHESRLSQSDRNLSIRQLAIETRVAQVEMMNKLVEVARWQQEHEHKAEDRYESLRGTR